MNAHKTMKWWKKGFFHVLEVAFVNASIIYKRLHPEIRKLDVNAFRLRLIEQLLKTKDEAHRPGRHVPAADNPRRLTERHFLAKNEAKTPNGKQAMPDCVVCSNRAVKRHQTQFCCKECNVALCAFPCFTRYYTLKDYKTNCSKELHT